MPAATNSGLRSAGRVAVTAIQGAHGTPELFTCRVSISGGPATIEESSHACSVAGGGTGRYTITLPSAAYIHPLGLAVADSDDTLSAAEATIFQFGDIAQGATTSIEIKCLEADGGTMAFATPSNSQTFYVTALLYRR
jgi:hypothetical protein